MHQKALNNFRTPKIFDNENVHTTMHGKFRWKLFKTTVHARRNLDLSNQILEPPRKEEFFLTGGQMDKISKVEKRLLDYLSKRSIFKSMR